MSAHHCSAGPARCDIALGALLFGEPFTVWVAFGTALVSAGIYVFARGGR
ncbi:MAG: hypothetical protein ABIR55_06760 [Burkholderiaceae bacterium]